MMCFSFVFRLEFRPCWTLFLFDLIQALGDEVLESQVILGICT